MMKNTKISAILLSAVLAIALGGCASGTASASSSGEAPSAAQSASMSASDISSAASAYTAGNAARTATVNSYAGGILDTSDLFTDRDLQQTADLTDAVSIAVASGQDIDITEEGVYVINGTATNCTIRVNADSSAKVQLVLDGVSITNSDAPAIYVVNADKVFITTAEGSTNTLTATETFAADGDEEIDAVVYSKDDIVLNGLGTLKIVSSDNGITGKDDVKITGGAYAIDAGNHAIRGKDSVAITDGTFTLTTGKDGIHSENGDDPTKGYVYVADGTFSIDAQSDGIEGDAAVQIDGGTFTISCEEGIEGTYVQINGGTISIDSSDDGINATSKSTAYDVVVEINGGEISIDMAAGDTDGIDSNGGLIINGGTIDINAQSPFDFDGQGQLNGGTVYVNGQQVTQLSNQMMGGGMMGGSQGSMGPQGSMGSMGSMGPGGGRR